MGVWARSQLAIVESEKRYDVWPTKWEWDESTAGKSIYSKMRRLNQTEAYLVEYNAAVWDS